MIKERDNEAFARHVQQRLTTSGHYRGKIDGWAGPTTQRAYDAATNMVPAAVKLPAVKPRWPHQSEVAAFFGPPGEPACTNGKVTLPMPFSLAWELDTKVRRFSCHSKVATALNAIFNQAYAHYGEARFVELRLNLYGGCFELRKMRNTSGGTLSMHSWGIAVDLDPERNQLKWGRDKAVFAKPEYEPFWKIVEAQGAVSLGRVRNFDWMHFQFATL